MHNNLKYEDDPYEDEDQNEDDEESGTNVFGPSVYIEHYRRNALTNPDAIIIPKVVERKHDDSEVEAIVYDEEEDEEDKHQNFFVHQIHFERPHWPEDKWWFSIVAMSAFMVDMSNVTSFPTNVSQHGGIAYLIAYFTVLLCFAYPMLHLEVILGQYFQTGMVGVWGIAPFSRGLGTSFIYINLLILAVPSPNILWAAIMLMESLGAFTSGTLRWATCTNDWNTCNCTGNRIPDCPSLNSTINSTDDENPPALEFFIGHTLQMWKTKYADPSDITDLTQNGNWSEAYGFNNQMEGLGSLVTTNCIVTFAIFAVIMMLSLINLKHLGYFYTFTAFYTLLVLGLLVCRALTLDGAFAGLEKYFRTDLWKLLDIKMWAVAFESAFYSTGSGFGCLLVQASYNTLSHNFRRDAMIAIGLDTLTSLLATFVGFMFVGHLFDANHKTLPEQFPGDNFVYIAQAEAFARMAGSSFFAALFYFMIVVFCIDTQVVAFSSLSFSLFEEYKRKYPAHHVPKALFLYSVWGFALSITLMCTTRGGFWITTFLRQNAFGPNMCLFMLLEAVVVTWIWGIEEICIAVDSIIPGCRPGIIVRVCWKYLVPVILTLILIHANLLQESKPVSVFGQEGPESTARLGFIFQWISVALLISYLIYIYLMTRGKGRTCLQVFMLLISPEYEHEDILRDVKSAKRLKCGHYIFLLFDDEKRWFKEKVRRFCKNLKEFCGCKRKEKVAEPPTVLRPAPAEGPEGATKKEKKKKKKEKEEKGIKEESVWEKLEKFKKEEEEEQEKEMEKGKQKKVVKKRVSPYHFSPRPSPRQSRLSNWSNVSSGSGVRGSGGGESGPDSNEEARKKKRKSRKGSKINQVKPEGNIFN